MKLVQPRGVEQQAGRDTRSRCLVITAAGRAKHAEAKRHWKRAQLALNATLGTAQVAALHELIDGALAQLNGNDSSTSD